MGGEERGSESGAWAGRGEEGLEIGLKRDGRLILGWSLGTGARDGSFGVRSWRLGLRLRSSASWDGRGYAEVVAQA